MGVLSRHGYGVKDRSGVIGWGRGSPSESNAKPRRAIENEFSPKLGLKRLCKCKHRRNLLDTSGTSNPTFWTGVTVPPFFRTRGEFAVIIRGDLRKLNYAKTVFGMAPPSTPPDSRALPRPRQIAHVSSWYPGWHILPPELVPHFLDQSFAPLCKSN